MSERQLWDVQRKFAVLFVTATLLCALNLTTLLTLPGGYYDEVKEIPTDSPHIPYRTNPFPTPPPPPPPPAPVHNVGESKLSDSWKFYFIMYSAGFGLLLSMAVIIIYMAAKGEELKRWNTVYAFCRKVMCAVTGLSFMATILLICSIIGCHTHFAAYMIVGGFIIGSGSLIASNSFWYS